MIILLNDGKNIDKYAQKLIDLGAVSNMDDARNEYLNKILPSMKKNFPDNFQKIIDCLFFPGGMQ